jgi:hypothetical protein
MKAAQLFHPGEIIAAHTRRARSLVAFGALGALLLACGSNGAGNGGSGNNNPPGGGAANSGGGASGDAPTSGSAGSFLGGGGTAQLHLPAGDAPIGRMHKLTATEFANSVHDLLGNDAPLSAVEPDNVVNGFASVGATTVAMSAAGVALYETASGSATEFAFSDATHAAKVASCVPQNATDSACFSKAVSAFGRRAFRRPLTDVETARFVKVATTIAGGTGGTALMGLRHAVWAILQSPNFLYRTELGVASAADGGRLKFTSFEMASRLAAALWNGAPDDPVLDAAASDTLATADGVRSQAQRMLADPRAHRALSAFVDDLYGVRNLAEASKDPALFPKFTVTVKDAMQKELEQRVDDMVFSAKGDFLSLYDSRTTFVNKELAAYYGLPAPTSDSFQRVDLPGDSPRVGLLGAGAILSAFALPQRSSPTERGKFVASALLCIDVPPPPPGVPPLPTMLDTTATMRERMTAHRTNASCASCHAIMDPIGFGLEHFDSGAMYRDMDNGKAIDTTGQLTDGAKFDGLAQLGGALRNEPLAGACFVSKVYQNALGRPAIALDDDAINGLAAQFAANKNQADQLLLNVVSSEAFRFVAPNKG